MLVREYLPVRPEDLARLLEQVASGDLAPAAAAERLKDLPYEDLGFAKLDHHRSLRRGFPEVVFGAGKTPEQIAAIMARLGERGPVLVTRASLEAASACRARFPELVEHPLARILMLPRPGTPKLPGRVGVVCAGTSDLPVAEEAALTLEFLGAEVERLQDVGVAGLHRLLDRRELLRRVDVLVVVAGMEGALPSLIAGLVDAPVIAVPTSVGYGASFGGLAANGGYNIRVARSQSPAGPYFDAAGTNMDTVRGNPAVLFDDTRIAPHGQKLVGNFQYSLATGETGNGLGNRFPLGKRPSFNCLVTLDVFADDAVQQIFATRLRGFRDVVITRNHLALLR